MCDIVYCWSEYTILGQECLAKEKTDSEYNAHSKISTNGHLTITATFFVLAGSPYIDSSLNFSTMATSVQEKWPLKRVPNCQRPTKKSRIVTEFFPCIACR